MRPDRVLVGLCLAIVLCMAYGCAQEIKRQNRVEECQKQCMPFDFALHYGQCYCETTRKAN